MKQQRQRLRNIIHRFDRSADHFGLCPKCCRSDYYLNVGPDHWMVCERHKHKWNFGANLFSLWRKETEADWERNARVLTGYTEVEPVYVSPPELPPAISKALDRLLLHLWIDEASDYAATTSGREKHIFMCMRVIDAWMGGLAKPTPEEC